MSVREAQSRIDAREFAEWIAYRSISPFARDRADYLAASIAHHICLYIAASHGAKTGTLSGIKLENFLLKFGAKKKGPQTAAEQRAIFNAARAAAEGANKRARSVHSRIKNNG